MNVEEDEDEEGKRSKSNGKRRIHQSEAKAPKMVEVLFALFQLE